MKCPYCRERLTIIKRGQEYHCYHCNRDLRRTVDGGFCEVEYEDVSGSRVVGLIFLFLGFTLGWFTLMSSGTLWGLLILFVFLFIGIGLLSYRPYTIVGYPPPKETRYKLQPLPPSFEGIRTPSEFERAIAKLLEKMEYTNVRHVGGAGDKAIDVTCEKDGYQYAVQCKKWKKKVGSRAMQKFCAMMKFYHEINRGIFVTTSSFTEDAKDIATKFNVELIDGFKLKEFMDKYGQGSYVSAGQESWWSYEVPTEKK